MPTSSVGAIDKRCNWRRHSCLCRSTRRKAGAAGVTLLEVMIVVTLMAIVAGLSYPSVASGLDSLRLRAASNAIVGFLNVALDRAERHQQVVEISISPRQNTITARSADAAFAKRLEIPETIRILSVLPRIDGAASNETREFLLYPGGGVPALGVEIASASGKRRTVRVDPITGVPVSTLQAVK
jgi:prepilin-type N-terminal cleavage/methylation domain-containing protein